MSTQPLRRTARSAALAFLLGIALLALAGPAGAQQPAVLTTEVTGPITPVIASHVADAVAEAERRGSEALVVRIDTPGGLETSMRDIVQTLFGSRVPVIVHVAPSGAQAASAGAVITFAAHVAAMAPGTNIGAATPVALGGGEATAVDDKIVNNSAAYVETIAEERGRDVDFAVDTVREGRSAPAPEAVEIGAVDLIADDLPALLDAVDGRRVTVVDDESVRLDTADAAVEDFQMSLVRRLLQAVADPNLAYLFLSIGTLALIYELASPGAGLGGVVGAIMLILAFFALSVLPVDVVGLLLLALAVGLFIAEAFVPGIGVFAGGGALALVFAGLFLFQRATGVGVDLTFLLPVPVVAAGMAVAIGRFAWRSQHRPAFGGPAGTIVGQHGVVRSVDGAVVTVLVDGALWRAHGEGPLEVGARVLVTAIDGLTLRVAAALTPDGTAATSGPPVDPAPEVGAAGSSSRASGGSSSGGTSG